MILRQGIVNKPVADVCANHPREIRVAFDKLRGLIDVDTDTNTMVPRKGFLHEEILSSFLLTHNLIPIGLPARGSSFFDEETGLWTGVIGLVSLVSHICCPQLFGIIF